MQQTILTTCDFFLDPRLDAYLRSANIRVSQAFRPATQKNQQYVLKLFIGFALAMRLDYSCPSVPLILAFIEHLAATQRTAASVLSTVSTLRSVLPRHGFSTTAFAHSSVGLHLRSVKINKGTPAVQRPPIKVADLRIIIRQLAQMDNAPQLVAAVLLLFTTAFRQSNLAPAVVRGFDPSRHLIRRDIRLGSTYVQVLEKWSKTRQMIVRDRWISVPRVLNSQLCLHAAMSALLAATPSVRSDQPLLTFEDNQPMSLSYINKSFKLALLRAGLSKRGLTLHSLRRGGARYLQQSGVPSSDIASHGGWKSAAIYRYIDNPTKPAAFRALQALK